jgi:hypothetical protein
MRFVTLTARYDPCDPDDVTVDALRTRVTGLGNAIRHLWQVGLRDARDKMKQKRKGAGLAYGIECAGSGNVHLHFVYLGGFIPKEWLENTAREAFEQCGFSKINNVVPREGENHAQATKRALRETLKYAIKGTSPLCERWFSERREVQNPTLVARWEMATHGLHLQGRFGSFRTSTDEAAKSDPPSISPVPCPHCGAELGYHTTEVETWWWVSYCHLRGWKAFRGGRADPIPIPDDESQRWMLDLVADGYEILEPVDSRVWLAARAALSKTPTHRGATEVFFI